MSAKVEPKTESARTWWNRGREAERQARTEQRRRLPIKVRHLLTYLDQWGHSEGDEPVTVANTLAAGLFVFGGDFTRAERRQLRRAIRGKL